MKTISSVGITGDNFIGKDLFGYPFNRKYPPDTKRFGTHYSGYRTAQQETFFYDFAVQNYDVRFKYKGQNYYIVNWEDVCARTDETLKIIYERFSNPLELIEQLTIDGVKLIDFMNEIEEVEVF